MGTQSLSPDNSFTAVRSVATLWIHLIGGGGRIGQNNPEDVHSGQEGKEWCVCGDLDRVEVNGPWLFLDNIKEAILGSMKRATLNFLKFKFVSYFPQTNMIKCWEQQITHFWYGERNDSE